MAREDLRSSLAARRPIQAMATHSPLSGALAEEAGFEALWASGFEFSALMGLPDISLVSMTQHLDMLRVITGRVGIPVVADLDTGFGNALNVRHAVAEYERAGAAAVVIEDKQFPKVSSLTPDGRQELVRTEEFQGKVEAARDARRCAETVIIARTEALIAGLGIPEALARAAAYAEAGADAVLVHSKSKTPAEIEAFIEAWDSCVPLVLVPTAYPEMSVDRMGATGKVGLAIWGNHAIRACVAAMRTTFAQVRRDGGVLGVEPKIATVGDVFSLQGMDEVKALEKRYLR
jgi:phosphoenolpyruvate phosphomutase